MPTAYNSLIIKRTVVCNIVWVLKEWKGYFLLQKNNKIFKHGYGKGTFDSDAFSFTRVSCHKKQ
jgi:hypothetical protein